MKIIVTGASGFIGRYVVEELRERGHAVLAPGLNGPRLELRDSALVAEYVQSICPGALIHCAWYGGDDRTTAAANVDWVAYSARLLAEFIQAGGWRVVTVGSCFEYASDNSPIHEATPVRPRTLYGAAKATLGDLVANLVSAGAISGAHARIGYVYGPGERPPRLAPALIQALRRGQRFPTTDALQLRDYLHVGDVAAAIAVVLESGIEGAVNVGSGSAIQLRQFIHMLATAVGRPDLIDLGGVPARAGEPQDMLLENSRLTSLGWSPRIDLSDGIADMVRHTETK